MITKLKRIKFYHRNADNAGADTPCAVCGLGIRTARVWVWVTGGGDTIQTIDHQKTDPAGDLGFHPVGPSCAAKKWIRPFLIMHPYKP